MPSHSDYAQALQIYGGACDDVTKRIIQDRALHTQNMSEAYMSALSDNMPEAYLNTIEQAIGERSIYNDRKMIMDAGDLTRHDMKLNQMLGANVGTLSGGGVSDNSRGALDGLKFSCMRSNALYANFNQKLAQDRALHMHELKALHSMTPSGTATKQILGGFIQSRTTNNMSRTTHDASMWASTDTNVTRALGGGAHQVISYGVEGSVPRHMSGGGKKKDEGSLPLHNEEAAKLWGEILNGGGDVMGEVY
jgi:hypothetical protein